MFVSFFGAKLTTTTPLSERTYAAYMHALVKSERQSEANSLLESMREDRIGDGVRPGIACYTACMLSAMQYENWRGVLDLYKMMKEDGLSQSTNTLHAVILSSKELGIHNQVIEAVENAIQSETPIDKSTFNICMHELLPEIHSDGDMDRVIDELRKFVKRYPNFAHDVLDLVKCVRTACIADHQNYSTEGRRKRDNLWREALSRTFHLSQIIQVEP